MKNNSIRAGSYYIFGNFFNIGIQFLTIPIFTRIISTNDYGIINTYLPIVGILSLILGLALDIGVRAAFVDYENRIYEVMYSITMLTIINSILTWLVSILVILIFNLNLDITLVFIALVHGFSNAIIKIFLMYLMMKNQYKSRTLLLLLPNLLSTIISIFAIIFLFESNKYLGKIIPSSIVTFLIALIVLVLIFRMKTNEKPRSIGNMHLKYLHQLLYMLYHLWFYNNQIELW